MNRIQVSLALSKAGVLLCSGQVRALVRTFQCGVSGDLGLVFLCIITITALHAADAPLTCRVLSQSEDGQVLILLSHANMLPGMELVLARGGERVGRVRVERIDEESVLARVTDGEIEGPLDDLVAAPLPFPVSAFEDRLAYVYVPPGLERGELVTITREGRIIGMGRFEDYEPMRLVVLQVAEGDRVKVGDLCYLGLLPGAQELPAVPQRPAAVPSVPPAGKPMAQPPEGAAAPTVSGLTGLVRVPTAEAVGDGQMRLSWTLPPSDEESPRMGGATTYAMTIGLLPKTELAFGLGEREYGHDLTLHAKAVLRQQAGSRPGIAAGVVDIKRKGAGEDPTGYLVATKRMADDRLALTLGAAVGKSSGPLAGLSYRLGPILEVQGEYDSRDVNLGLAAQPSPGLWLRVADVDVGTAFTGSYQFSLAHPGQGRRRMVAVGPSQLTLQEAVTLAQSDLVELGMEDVQVTIEEEHGRQRLVAAYENRMFTLNELDGMVAGLEVAARGAPASVDRIALRVKRQGLTTVEVETATDSLRRYARGETSPDAFGNQLQVTLLPPSQTNAQALTATSLANRSYGHADLSINPGIRSIMGTETTTLQLGWYSRPQIRLPLGRGLLAEGRWSYPVAGPLVRDEAKRLTTDRAVLAYAARPFRGCLGQVFAGRFPQQRQGVAVELVKPRGGRGLWHGVWAALEHEDNGQRPYLLAEYWHLLPQWDTQVRAFGGRFLDDDSGWGLDVIRYFNEVQFGVGVRDTDFSRRAEVRLVVPLGPRRQPRRPSTVRLRTADWLDYRHRSIIRGPNYVPLASITANELFLGPDLIDRFLNRNRHLPAYVRTHLR